MQLPGYLEFEISRHHIKETFIETFIETLTAIIGIALTHNARSYAGWWLHMSISDTVNTIDIVNLI